MLCCWRAIIAAPDLADIEVGLPAPPVDWIFPRVDLLYGIYHGCSLPDFTTSASTRCCCAPMVVLMAMPSPVEVTLPSSNTSVVIPMATRPPMEATLLLLNASVFYSGRFDLCPAPAPALNFKHVFRLW
jgi:hypothetical protein